MDRKSLNGFQVLLVGFVLVVLALPAYSQALTFTQNLTLGSTGADVVALQNILVAGGYLTIPAGVAPGYFGQLTKAALARYQAAVGISPAAGYFGPITRARLSPVAGTPTPTPGTPSPTPSGDEGTLEDFDQLSKYSAEEVGEGEDDVKVLGIEFAAEDADQTIERVEVVIDAPTDGDDLEDFIQDVSIWLDGKELARKDVDEASHDRDEDEYTFRFTGLNGLVDEGDMAQLIVAVTGVNNIDSGDATEGWTVAIPADGIRAVSPNGVSDEFEDLFDETFTLETFADASSVELRVATDRSTPLPRVINVKDDDETENIPFLIGSIEAKNSTIHLFELPITLTVTGATDVDAIVNRLILEIDGNEYTETVSTSAAAATVIFDDLDISLEPDKKLTFTIKGDINEIDTGLLPSAFDEGDILQAELTATNRDFIDAEDDSGETLSAADMEGTASGEEITFFDVAFDILPPISFGATTQTNNGSDNDTGVFSVSFNLRAFDGTVYVSTSAVATTATEIRPTISLGNSVIFRLEKGDTATTTGLDSLVTFSESGGAETSANGNIELEDGESTILTLTVARTNEGNATDNGIYRLVLAGFGFNKNDSALIYLVSDFGLEIFQTESTSID